MKPWVVLLILCVSCLLIGVFASSDVVLSLQRPSSRSLLSLSPKQDVELAAAPNGTIYLVHSDSRKVIWSFPSGPPIYSSYRAAQKDDENDHSDGSSRYTFLDCGDDWELYLHHNYGKLKLEGTIEDYVKKTPIYEDDEVTVGSMHSTVFKVDLWTGRLIHEYGRPVRTNGPNNGTRTLPAKDRKELGSIGPPSATNSDVELYIERIDYSLATKAFDKLLWNLSIGFFKAKVRCRGIENLLHGTSLNLDHKLGSGSDTYGIVSLPCEFEFPVRRFLRQSMFNYFLRLDGVLDPHRENMLSADDPGRMPPLPHKDDEISALYRKGPSLPLPHHLRPGMREALEIAKSSRRSKMNDLGMQLRRFVPWSVVLLVVLLMGYVVHHKYVGARANSGFNLVSNVNSQPSSSRRRRSRKSVRSIAILEEGQTTEKAIKSWPNLNSHLQSNTDGRTIGRLFVSTREIAKGGNGTVVYEGVYEGRKVAVKRMVQAHHDVAFKEIQNLIASDQHPNIVRWYGVEYDHDFVYLALEHCSCSLNDLVESYTDCSQNLLPLSGKAPNAVTEYEMRLKSVKASVQHIELWRNNGYPSVLLLKLMRDVVSGLVHLHELGIVHRDIKPQNVLVSKERGLCAKLSDMGISKRLLADMSSLGHQPTGHGSSGWQAPEQLLHGRQTRAVDMFSLGCVLFFCVTGGKHPFGNQFERDANIIRNQVDLFLVENIPEALELLSRLLQRDPQMRPMAVEVLHHPLFWTPEMRLSFLRDASDRVELEDRESSSDILKSLESVATVAIGAKWNEKMEPLFINNIGQYRRYKYESVRDLLRVIRNKLNHYRELPADVQALLGTVPDGFDEYFSSKFPRLLIEVYKVVNTHCKAEKWFQKYLHGGMI